MAGRGQLILVASFDAHLFGRDRGVLTHGQTGPRLTVGGDLDTKCRRHPAGQLDPVQRGTRASHRQQRTPQVVPQADRGVRGGVHTTGGGHLVAARCDTVGGGDRRLQSRSAGLLQIERRGVGRQRATQHAFAHQVEVPAVLEHRAADHRVEARATEAEPICQTRQHGGEHVLVRGLCVGAVGSCERNAVAAEHGDPAMFRCGHVRQD